MELFRLLGTIAINSDGAKKAIDDVTDTGEKAQSKLSGAFSKIGNAALAVGKVAAVGAGACATALAAIGKSAVDNFADYEQLVGGSKLLFGEAYDFVAEKAKNAYKDVQMSQNEYLEQMNGFATGLKTALDGNEHAAAELASRIITAEADIVAATGNSQEAVQNAFNGIMKSNFTMLDNLQLGITPTKEGFQQVIDKVNEWNKANGEATSYQIDNLADCQSALVDYVEMQGLANYAANEGASTIAGSASAMKAAWQNMLTGIADENANIPELLDNLFVAVGNFGKNIIPRIGVTIQGIGTAIKKAIPKITKEIAGMIDNAFQSLGNKFGKNSLFGDVVKTFSSMWGAVKKLGNAMSESESVTSGFANAFSTMAAVMSSAWENIGKPTWEAVISGINWLAENWAVVSDNMSATFEGLWLVCQSAWVNIGQPIWDFIMSAVSMTNDAFARIMPQVQKFFQNAVSGIKDSWNNHLKPALDAIGKFLNDVLMPIFKTVFEVIIQPLVENTFEFIKNLWENTLKPVFDGICDFLLGVFTLDFEKAFNGLNDIAEGCFNAMQTTVETVFKTITDIISGAIDKIKEFFGFAEEANNVDLPSGEPTHGGGGGARDGASGGGGARSASFASANNMSFARSAAVDTGTVTGTQPVSNVDIANAIKDALRDFKVVVQANVVPDKQGIFKIVQTEAEIWKESTGKEAFA